VDNVKTASKPAPD